MEYDPVIIPGFGERVFRNFFGKKCFTIEADLPALRSQLLIHNYWPNERGIG